MTQTPKPFVIPHQADEWSEEINGQSFRTWERRGIPSLWRKTVGEQFLGGYQIHVIACGTRLANEWLDGIKAATGRPLIGWEIDENGNC